ncbi:hypothetical protein IJ118_02180 [Candidatus Saccharibacteria bacterium]|nr:hypothetical protein [Candidatus Saccharibacteria bacterium]
MDDNLRENDPYRGMEDAERGVRPDFLRKNDERRRRVSGAAQVLRGAEGAAGAKRTTAGKSGVAGAAAGEASGGRNSLYTGSGKGPQVPKKAGVKARIKKLLPAGVIAGIIAIVGGLMVGAQSMMPVAISELITERLNSIGVSSTESSDVWLDSQLNRAAGIVENKAGDVGADLFDLTDYQLQSFVAQGMRIAKDDNGNVLAILYKKDDIYIPVVGSQVIGRSGLVDEIKSSSGLDNVGTPIIASTAFDDRDFKMAYTELAQGWRGGMSGWFDQIMANVTEIKLSVNRNRWARWLSKSLGDTAADLAKLRAEFDATASESKALSRTTDSGVEAGYVNEKDNEVIEHRDYYENENGTHNVDEVSQITDDNGNVKGYVDRSEEDVRLVGNKGEDSIDSVKGSNASQSEKLSKINSILNSKALKAASKVADYGCALLEGIMTVYTVASAYQSMQFLNLVSGYLEAVDKMKAGYGNESPINEYSTNLVTVGETVQVVNGEDKVVARKTAMESQGMANLFSNIKVNPDDPSVQNVNFESVMSNISVITGNIKDTAAAFEACGYAKAAFAAVDVISTVISFIPIVGQGIKVIEITGKEALKAGVKALVAGALKVLIPIAAKEIANLVIKNAATEWFGEDLGNALMSGANKYLGGNGTSGGQSPGSESKVLAYLNTQDAVIADKAEYIRATKDPFDITSRYTFMGSMAYMMMPLAYQSGGVSNVLKNVSSLTSSALIALTPTTSAYGIANTLTSRGDCDLLGTTGAVGDAYCNPYIITDVSTIETEPFQAYKDTYYLKGYYMYYASVCNENGKCWWENRGSQPKNAVFDENGHVITPDKIVFDDEGKMIKHGDVTPSADKKWYEWYSDNLDESGKIKKNSELAKYVTYCGQRTSQYGVRDMTIAAQVSGQNDTVIQIMGAMPVIGDFADIITGLRDEANMGWSNGRMCVASEVNNRWDNEMRYYQRYDEDLRLLESTDPGYKSAVTAYLEGYYTDNPIDTSFEGTLARFSGMTVEQVDEALALIEYYDFISKYDPTERVAFGEPTVEIGEERLLLMDGGSVSELAVNDVRAILPNMIVYADVRNRVNVV